MENGYRKWVYDGILCMYYGVYNNIYIMGYVYTYIYIDIMGCVYTYIYIMGCVYIYIYGIHITTYHIIYNIYIHGIHTIYMVETYPLAQLNIPPQKKKRRLIAKKPRSELRPLNCHV